MARVATKRRVDLAALKRRPSSRTLRRAPDPVALPAEESVAIGFHLRRERRLRKAAAQGRRGRNGLSVSLISKIETNKVSPSLSTLHKVAKALGTSVSALFAIRGDDRASRVPARATADRRRVADDARMDGIEAEIMVPYAAGRLLEGFVFIMQPGGHSGGLLQHDGEECGYVLSASSSSTVGGTRHELNPGGLVLFSFDDSHAYRNPERSIARVLWINTAATF